MRRLSIVTIDDERHVHDGLDALIEWAELGFDHAGRAFDGQEGLELIRRTRPDVVITDIKMPEMDGIALIEAVRRSGDHQPVIIVASGYGEFEYAQAAVRFDVDDYILKPIDEAELSDRLRLVRSRLSQQRQDAVGTGEGVSAQTLLQRVLADPDDSAVVAELERALAGPAKLLYAYGMLVPPAPPVAGNPAFLSDAIAPIVRGALEQSKIGRTCDWAIREPGGAVGFLVAEPDLPAGATERAVWTRGLYKSISSILGRATFMGIGPRSDSPAGLAASRDALHRYLNEFHCIGRVDSVCLDAPDPPGGTVVPIAELSAIMVRIETCGTDDALRALDAFFKDLRDAPFSPSSLRSWLYTLVAETRSLFEQLEVTPPTSLARIEETAQRAHLLPVDAVRGTVHSSVQEICATLERLRQDTRNYRIVAIRKEIDRRFADDITLVELAGAHGLSPVYLGRRFREVTGTGFRDYLRSRRIAEACRLLRETNLLVNDIAERVGYATYDYFVEQFRRETGTTPSRLRG